MLLNRVHSRHYIDGLHIAPVHDGPNLLGGSLGQASTARSPETLGIGRLVFFGKCSADKAKGRSMR